MGWIHERRRRDETGFTLIELLVVILIIGILASIAIVVFRGQRQRALVSQLQTGLTQAAQMAEGFGVDNAGSFLNISVAGLQAQGLKLSPDVGISVTGNVRAYCIVGAHFGLPTTHAWRVASYWSGEGRATEEDGASCLEPTAPAAPPPPSGGGVSPTPLQPQPRETCEWVLVRRGRFGRPGQYEYRCRTF